MFGLTRVPEREARRERNPLALFRNEMDELFRRFLEEWRAPDESFWTMPSWEWEETEKEYVGRAPVPGFAPNEIDVRLSGNELMVRAEHREEGRGPEKTDGRYERWGRFERRVTLPPGVDVNRVEAMCRNGMLEIHMPRLPEAKVRSIPVKG
ncbi:MAG: Hsp20/alpha crystallin family protein [Gemmataceae bacterium]|nr:Hsp20/alpha crystallin family protein [Gemmataceae bacterium]